MKIRTIISHTFLATTLLSTFAVAPVQAVDFIALAKDMVHGWLHGNAEWLNEYPPMLQAIYKNDRQAVEDLLASGTDVNEVYSFNISYDDANGSQHHDNGPKTVSALFFAAYYDKTEMCELLLAHGANPNLLSPTSMTPFEGDAYYEMPLHIAVRSDNRRMVEALIRHKADVNAPTKDKSSFHSRQRTPLFFVQSEAVAKMLLDAGADVTFRCSHNRDTAINWAENLHPLDNKLLDCLYAAKKAATAKMLSTEKTAI